MNDQKEMKLLLDMYKGVSKEQRDKVQLMAIEKKLRSDIEDLRNQLKKMQVRSQPEFLYLKPFSYIFTFSGEQAGRTKEAGRWGRSA